MNMIYKLIDKMMGNPTPVNLMALDKIMRIGVPFNAPHGFKIMTLSHEAVIVSLPNRKLNHNHLGGIHACAMATAGEYCAGLSLLASFGISKYRLILSELNVKYLYQGRVDLEGYCSTKQIDVEKVKAALDESDKYLQELNTVIRDLDGKEIAHVRTVWQLKNWDKVNTKG